MDVKFTSSATARDNIERIVRGELTVAQLRVRVQHPNQINRAQSTHTTSVHKSVSDSALQLMQRYGVIINKSLEDTI